MTLEQRFWAKVDVRGPDECWEWQGATTAAGYGKLWGGVDVGTTIQATHVAVLLATGEPVPAGMQVNHSCDNPPCVNAHHLSVGTQTANLLECVSRGRHRPHRGGAKGSRHGHSRLTEEQIPAIRARYAQGGISLKRLGEEFGVSFGAVQRIVAGKGWTHV